jgi:hypothetical protein
MEPRRFEYHAGFAPRRRRRDVLVAADSGTPGVRDDQADQHAQRRRLVGSGVDPVPLDLR